MANQTLNQFRRPFEAFARTHGQLKTVEFNKQTDLTEGINLLYPSFHYTLNRARKESNQLVFYFTAWVSDLMLKEKANESEVWNDTLLIATDLAAWLDGNDRDFALTDGIDFRNFTESTGDLLAGVTFDFTVRYPFAYDECLIPEVNDGLRFLISEDGRYITTEDGRRFVLEN